MARGIRLKRASWRHLVSAVALFAMPLETATAQEVAPPASRAEQQQAAPEPATGRRDASGAEAGSTMVSAAHPLAAEAGLEILREGGSAVDAAIAVQMVLNLVEPQSSGIGGGAFILHWDAATRAMTSYDGRETAPASATPDRFLMPDGTLRDFDEAVASGLSVGVPGTLRVLELAHRKHGKLPWRRLFQRAIALAEAGFPVSRRLSLSLALQGPSTFEPEARAYFFDAKGWPRPPGHRLTNPAFAAVLRAIAEDGADAFYSGEIAQAIIAKLATAPTAPSGMTRADLAGYLAKERPPLCVGYRGNRVCGMGPPSSGGATVGMVLKLLEPFDLGRRPLEPDALTLIAEAQKLAYADRDRYLADSDFVPFPEALLSDDYLAGRRALIDPARPAAKQEPGTPPLREGRSYGIDATRESVGTSHLSIIDASGNALAMTTTIEAAFGSRIMVRGFLLNNELTDFAFRPTDDAGKPVANRVEPGKRPRSSMAPTIVLGADGEVRMVTGSPGGSRIILYVLKSLICVIDWGCDAQKAASLTNFGSRNGPFEVEIGAEGSWIGLRMHLRGHAIKTSDMTSGLHIIVRREGRLHGGADPRRDGVAIGD